MGPIMVRRCEEGMLAPGITAIVPPHGCHRLFWNNYPATAFDHDLSNAVEAALLIIGIDSFLRDPKGLTCITLHFYRFFRSVHQRYPDGQVLCLPSKIQETNR
jgi:hypothetical protein